MFGHRDVSRASTVARRQLFHGQQRGRYFFVVSRNVPFCETTGTATWRARSVASSSRLRVAAHRPSSRMLLIACFRLMARQAVSWLRLFGQGPAASSRLLKKGHFGVIV